MDFSDVDVGTSYKDLVKSVRRDANDLYSRLRSIDEDAAFVRTVKLANPELPLIPNLRCGAWYVDPEIAHPATPAYFKSTDGHESQWDFSLRRSNLNLLPLISEHGGIILVDSTRRGKRLPDALSKTIPAWCATINRALAIRGGHPYSSPSSSSSSAATSEAETGWEPKIWVPSRSVSDSERSQMEARLDGWAHKLLASSLNLPSLALPLRPIFLYNTPPPHSPPPTLPPSSILGFHPIICLSASQALDVSESRYRQGGWEYHQGAGDDHELWGEGLGSEDWWAWRGELIGDGWRREGLEEEVKRRVAEKKAGRTNAVKPDGKGGIGEGEATLIRPTKQIYLTTLSSLPTNPSTPTISIYPHLYPHPSSTPTSSSTDPETHLILSYHPTKSPHTLTSLFPSILSFATPHLLSGQSITLACEDGKDASVGAALILLQTFFDNEGRLREVGEGGEGKATKTSIQSRLHWVLNARAGANPSRATLKRVNTELMSGRYAP